MCNGTSARHHYHAPLLQSRDAGASDILAVLRTLLAPADGAPPRHPAAARQLHDAATAAAEDVLAISEQETEEPQYRDALIGLALRAAAAVDGFAPEVGSCTVKLFA